MVSPQSVGREKDRIASCEEHKSKADELLKKEMSKGYVQRAVNRGNIGQDVGPLQLAKIAVRGESSLDPRHAEKWHQLQSDFPGASREGHRGGALWSCSRTKTTAKVSSFSR